MSRARELIKFIELRDPAIDAIKDRNIRNEVIRKQGSQYCVKSKKGKNMGCYPSKKQANKRLGQIHYFKGK